MIEVECAYLEFIVKMELRCLRRYSGSLMWLICVIMTVSATSGESEETSVGAEAIELGDGNVGLTFEDWSRVLATEQSPKWRQNLDKRPFFRKDHAPPVEVHADESVSKDTMQGDRLMDLHRQAAAVAVKDMEHRVARDALHEWLTPSDKWHFVIGFTNMRAYSAARKFTRGAHVHHFPTGKSSLHFFLTFISAGSAALMRTKPIFHAVEPLLPYLKIEDLTLGKLIRDQEEGKQAPENSHNESLALKATLALAALTFREVEILARLWEVALRLESQELLLAQEYTRTMRYTDIEGQRGIHSVGEDSETYSEGSLHTTRTNSAKREMRNADVQVQSAPVIVCQVEVETAIVCSPFTKEALKGAANFMAAHAVVQLVELNPRYEVFNKWAKYVTQSVSGKRLTIFNKGLLGQGEVIACADTGIDMDHCFFRDKYRPVPFNFVNLQARKIVQYVISWGDKTDFAEGHGTHVAGSIAGDTEEGANEFAGMAPAAKIVLKMQTRVVFGTAFFDLGSNSSNLRAPVELGKGVFDYGFMAGARIFSNSWGVLRQGYSSNSHDVDSFSYLNENVLIIFAVGNQGTLGRGTVASPASSKNCLAVGASFNAAASLASEREEYSRYLMKPSTVAPFSSVGPTIDGRIKPDVLAPGMVVWSSVPELGRGPPEQNCQVGAKQGTSSSAPLVAGLASLARQYFREGYYPSGKKITKDGFIPSGALLKAVMIHSAVPEHRYVNSSGMNDLQLTPDYVQVLEKVLVFAKPRSKHQPSHLMVLSGRQDGAVIKHKSLHTFTFRVTSSKEPLRMTMVWMDPPAAPSSLHPVVNDLNLKAQGPNNKTIHPNGLDEADSINTVEVIHVMKPKKGRWTVTVEAARVVNDRQPYALVVTGGFRTLSRSNPGFRRSHYEFNVSSTACLRKSPHRQPYNCLWPVLGTFCSIICLFVT